MYLKIHAVIFQNPFVITMLSRPVQKSWAKILGIKVAHLENKTAPILVGPAQNGPTAPLEHNSAMDHRF